MQAQERSLCKAETFMDNDKKNSSKEVMMMKKIFRSDPWFFKFGGN